MEKGDDEEQERVKYRNKNERNIYTGGQREKERDEEKERIANNKIEGRNAETSGIEHSSLIVADELN